MGMEIPLSKSEPLSLPARTPVKEAVIRRWLWIFTIAVVVFTTACLQASPVPVPPPTDRTVTTPVAERSNAEAIPAVTPTTTAPERRTSSQEMVAPLAEMNGSAFRGRRTVLEVAPGTEARYRVREQLAGVDFPNDAVGVTQQVQGVIILDEDNGIVSAESRLVVDLRALKSDDRRRDRYLQRSTIDTARYPVAEFVPRDVLGLPAPLPRSGTAQFQLVGDLTIHGVSRPLTWEVSASFTEQVIAGRAATSFQFGHFDMTIPRVFLVLSVDDRIQLEIDFFLRRAEADL